MKFECKHCNWGSLQRACYWKEHMTGLKGRGRTSSTFVYALIFYIGFFPRSLLCGFFFCVQETNMMMVHKATQKCAGAHRRCSAAGNSWGTLKAPPFRTENYRRPRLLKSIKTKLLKSNCFYDWHSFDEDNPRKRRSYSSLRGTESCVRKLLIQHHI